MRTEAEKSLRAALTIVFGGEWAMLSASDKALIVRDCIEADEERREFDLAQYGRNIGAGNLLSYAKTQRVRFSR